MRLEIKKKRIEHTVLIKRNGRPLCVKTPHTTTCIESIRVEQVKERRRRGEDFREIT